MNASSAQVSQFLIISSQYDNNLAFHFFSPSSLIRLDNCHLKTPKCTNGVCLDHLCHCNDGFGGKGCDIPGESQSY